ncbi:MULTISPECIES: hypothetical protein [unclassified Methanosarcina]|uniref:hypothetical protein n=1 Tax=unclassified Methanosarcina TaxID=2644672 RepID=UPI000615DAEC|nr:MULTISPECIES: hypothetical protein [unclassified Methanosarcina]AKB18598.1 sensory transduction histidine kinase [Methanosarcina sp. WWM596]
MVQTFPNAGYRVATVSSGKKALFSMNDDKNCNILLDAFDHLTKPVEKSHLLSSLQRAKVTGTANSSPQILIVDDEPAIVELLGSIIEQEGYTNLRIREQGSNR